MMNENAPKEAPAWVWTIIADFRDRMRGHEQDAREKTLAALAVEDDKREELQEAVLYLTAIANVLIEPPNNKRAKALGLPDLIPEKADIRTDIGLASHVHSLCGDKPDWDACRAMVKAHLETINRHFPKQIEAPTVPKRRQAVTQAEAARIVGRTARTVQDWEKGKGKPQDYPGRGDPVTLATWAIRRKGQALVKRGVLNTMRGGDMSRYAAPREDDSDEKTED
jgi:hypothetical protein